MTRNVHEKLIVENGQVEKFIRIGIILRRLDGLLNANLPMISIEISVDLEPFTRIYEQNAYKMGSLINKTLCLVNVVFIRLYV